MGGDETGFQPERAFEPKRLTEARRVLQALSPQQRRWANVFIIA